ncbi:MAG: zf-HC2 domain-containing protein [Candidatus Xenobiia bacterium LiM19]
MRENNFERIDSIKCSEVLNNLPEYCEGSLSEDMMEKISGHLSQCRACGAEESFHRKTWDLLDSWSEIEPHHLYRARFWEKEAGRGALSHLIPRLRSALVPALCVIFLVISAALFLSSHNRGADLFTAEMQQWKPLDYMTCIHSINYSLAHGDDEDRLLARTHVILTVPQYLDDTVDSESSLYPEIPLGDTGVPVMERAQSVITDLAEGVL